MSSEQTRKLFIGGLNLETTEDSLKEYFSRWGECVDVVVMRHSDTGKARGFGFVTYEAVESVDAVLNVDLHILDDKKIDPKRAIAREEMSSLDKAMDTVRSEIRVFVGGLDGNTNEEDLRNCFTKVCSELGYGKIENIEIMRNKVDGKCRGFCFVTFDCQEIADKICAQKYFEILNKSVEVCHAESRLAMKERREKEKNMQRNRYLDRRHQDKCKSYEQGG